MAHSAPHKQSTELAVASKKQKAIVKPEEDSENVIIKIPHGITAISDPSSPLKFVKGFLLEEDEHRFPQLGLLEAIK